MWNAGFDESMGGGFLNNTTTVDSPSGKKKGTVKRSQSVVPVVIRMIHDYPGDEFKLFGMPVQIVSILGILKNFEIQSTKVTYTIEDHTASIKAIWWLEGDSGDGNPKLPAVKEGSYARVFGTIKAQDGDRSIMVLKMSLVDDCNIITTHLLEVIHTRLQAEHLSQNSASIIKQNNPGANLANSMTMFDENMADNGQLNLTPVQLKVFKILQADNSNAGADRSSILSNFPTNQRKEANDALEFLVSEGHAYTTIDTEHFKHTDA